MGADADKQACLKQIGDRPSVTEGFGRLTASLEGVGVDLKKTRFGLGPWLEIDEATGHITNAAPGGEMLDRARRLAQGTYRALFELPV